MKNFFYIVVAVFFLTSCERQLPFTDPGASPAITINGYLEPGNAIRSSVFRSSSILTPDSVDHIGGATIEIFVDGTSMGVMNEDEPNQIYVSPVMAAVGSEYTLKANAEGLPEVTASTYIPQPAQMSNLSIEQIEILGETTNEVSFDLEDIPDEKNYYILFVTIDDGNGYTFQQSFSSDEPIFEGGEEENYFYRGAAFTDDVFANQTRQFKVMLDYIDDSGFQTTNLFLVTASEEYYRYFLTYFAFRDTQFDPFAQPVQIYSNVENGHGIFAGFSSSIQPIN